MDIVNFVDMLDKNLKSIEKQRKYYEKIKSQAVLVHMDFQKTNNCVQVIDWCRNNVRNICYKKTREYGTAWWPIYNVSYSNRVMSKCVIGIGFKKPEYAAMFLVSGLYTND